jgi:hypothetical protein
VTDDEYVQEHFLTGGLSRQLEASRRLIWPLAAVPLGVFRVRPVTSAACSALRACVIRATDVARKVIAPIRPPPTLFGSVNATSLKVSGVHVFSAVDFLGTPGTKSVVLSDQGRSTYEKLVIAGGRGVGQAPPTARPPVKICS